MNSTQLIGRLTRDPQLKILPNQTSVVEFGMVANRTYTKNDEKHEEATFIDCACFGKGAEVINQYSGKGKTLLIFGRLKLDTWDDKNGGGKRSKLSVVVEDFQLGPRGEGDETDQRPATNRPLGQRPPVLKDKQDLPVDQDERFKEADIPF